MKDSAKTCGYERFSSIVMCPDCKSPMRLFTYDEKPYYRCVNGHNATINNGVLCFCVNERDGEEWSSVYENYEEYIENRNKPLNPNYLRGIFSQDVVFEKLRERKPGLILDLACGEGIGIGFYIEKIDWDCTVILTDLSSGILKWDKRYFESEVKNAHVDMRFISCDCGRLPIMPESVDAVISFCGIESMGDGYLNGLSECFRVLKNDGAAIYNYELVADKSRESTKKWLKLVHNLGWDTQKQIDEQFMEHDTWLSHCKNMGFITKSTKLYDELPAPEQDNFPYPNGVMQWMGSYVFESVKPHAKGI